MSATTRGGLGPQGFRGPQGVQGPVGPTGASVDPSFLNLKANLASPTFTGTVSGINNMMVGLGNVDNTSDLNKPVSSATQTALDLKAPLASPVFTGTVSGITKSMVDLANVDNTSDLDKPISTLTQSALNLKASTEFVNTSINNLIGGAPSTLDTLKEISDALGEDKNLSVTLTNSIALKAPLANPTFTGSVSGITKSMVGLGNVDNTTDALKPVSTATQTALNLKSNLANPTFTGTVSGITKSMVGLGNVDNTTDALKPVSTATQTALNLKANSSETYTYQSASFNLNTLIASPIPSKIYNIVNTSSESINITYNSSTILTLSNSYTYASFVYNDPLWYNITS